MKLPEISRALNDWQQMRNYNAELLAMQTRLTKERDELAAALREILNKKGGRWHPTDPLLKKAHAALAALGTPVTTQETK